MEEVGGCGRLQRGRRGRKCNDGCCASCLLLLVTGGCCNTAEYGRPVPKVTVPSSVVRRRCYHGFHVLRDPGVLRVPANGTTVDCEQLREDDQHVLEHHQFHVSAHSKLLDSPVFFRDRVARSHDESVNRSRNGSLRVRSSPPSSLQKKRGEEKTLSENFARISCAKSENYVIDRRHSAAR